MFYRYIIITGVVAEMKVVGWNNLRRLCFISFGTDRKNDLKDQLFNIVEMDVKHL